MVITEPELRNDGERGRLIDSNGRKHNNAGATEETLGTLRDVTKITDDSNKDDTSCIFRCRRNPITLISIVALALLIDKMAIAAFLLILPDYLRTMPSNVNTTTAAGYDNQSQQIGIIIALFNAVQIAGQIFAGILTHRCGHKCSFMLGVVLSFASLLVCALADRWWMLIFTSVLLGASACLTHVAGNSYVATIIEEKERRVFAFSIISYAKLLGYGFGYSLASYFYQWLGRSAPFLFMLSLFLIAMCLSTYNSFVPFWAINSMGAKQWEIVLFRAIGAVLISYSFMSLCLRNAA
ncbi:vesicular acetylcholine transporter-like [Tubulanus polymorphus]|uniref:vesicular acetylcholine transporter-like n=1 Tax=Tubulanus polymorphus TaxID=672921 RepID=UPI003DA5DD66